MKYRQDSRAFLSRKPNVTKQTPWPPGSEFVTIAEAADFLRCHRRTVERKLQKGDLPKYKDGSRTLIKRTDLLAHARKMRVQLQIGSCGQKVWIHTERGTQVRIRQDAGPIPIEVCDDRFPERVVPWPDLFAQAVKRTAKG